MRSLPGGATVVTRNGWLTGAGAVGLVLLGRLTGSFELFLLGAGAAMLLAVAALRTALARLDLRVSRHVEPPRVHAGSPARSSCGCATTAPAPRPCCACWTR